MKYENEFKNSKFKSFYQFIKNDGLVPTKSERLHKKKIYSNLMNNQKMTLENFEDFLIWDKKESIRNLIGEVINFEGISSIVNDISFIDNEHFKIHTKEKIINVEIRNFEKLCKEYIEYSNG